MRARARLSCRSNVVELCFNKTVVISSPGHLLLGRIGRRVLRVRPGLGEDAVDVRRGDLRVVVFRAVLRRAVLGGRPLSRGSK